jgi:hypothetical protein
MRPRLILVSLLLLSGCSGGYDRYEPPSVETRGVDANKLNNDTADCVDEKKAHGFIGDAGMIGQCLERKGYKIVTPRG